MRINHNLSSMTAQTSMFRVNRDMSKSLEKLSTGLRINRASDDAAGLGVSENLRTQVRGMQQALRNTQDTISMLQIADGALNEQANILQRMRELVIQAKNDTYTQTERDYMYQEFSGLMGELDRIAAVTNYNGMQLFASPEMNQGENQTLLSVSDPTGTPHALRDARSAWDDNNDSIFGKDDYTSANHFNMMIGANYEDVDSNAFNSTYESYQPASANMLMIQFGQMDANALLTKDAAYGGDMGNASLLFDDFNFDNTTDTEDLIMDYVENGMGMTNDVGIKFTHLLRLIDGNDEDIALDSFFRTNNGDGGGMTHNLTGLRRVSHMRANIGATINRLEHATNNLMNQITNTQAAESLIRDVDFASETAAFTRNQILTQSSTAMLAQANTKSQTVMQLFQ